MKPRLSKALPARLAALAVATTATLTTAGFASSPAQSVPSSDCPAAVDVSTLQAGDPVTGKTVLSGTTPTGFTGEVRGVLENGILPGVDLVMVDLGADPNISKIGIFEGMSGSPVYDGNGDLIGAVAYGFSTGPSAIAGVTPASEMQTMLSAGNAPALAAPRTVPLPRAMARSLVADGSATQTQVSAGMHPLATQFAISGLSPTRTKQMAPLFRMGKVTPMAAPGGPTSQQDIPVEAGGTMVAGMSYGDIAAAAIGTATMKCGNETVGFGHPMNFTGPATMTLHGADTLLIQNDPTLAGFKLVNIGKPQGTVDQDVISGIHGVDGALPAQSPVTSSAHAAKEGHASSEVTVPEIFSQIAFSSMLSAQDRALNRMGGGAGTASWTVTGTYGRAHKPFTLNRSDMYADPGDLSGLTAITLADQLGSIEFNGIDDVRFGSATTDSTLNRPYETLTISRVQVLQFGRWVTLHNGRPAVLRAGMNNYFRVGLTSKQLDPRVKVVKVFVPRNGLGRMGTLDLFGGNSGLQSEDDFFDEGFGAFMTPASATVPQIIKDIESAPKHNEVVAQVHFPTAPAPGNVMRTGKTSLLRVVDGGIEVPVRGVR